MNLGTLRPLLLLAFIASVHVTSLDAQGPNQLSGIVLGKNLFGDLRPLAWARVVLRSGEAIVTSVSTGDNGFYVIFAPPGVYELSVYYPGYVTQTISVVASGAILGNLNFYMEQGVSLYVKTDPDGVEGVQGEGIYSRGSQVTINITKPAIIIRPGVRYVFSHWSGDYSGTESTAKVVMDGPKNVVANFKTQYLLTVANLGATPASSEMWVDAGSKATSPSTPEMVPLEAGKRVVFTGWSLEGVPLQGNPITITMDGPKKVSANYMTQYFLSVKSEMGAPKGEGWYDAGSTATYSVTTPIAMGGAMGSLGARYVLRGWTGDASGTSPSASLRMDGPRSVAAVWDADFSQAYASIGLVAALLTVLGAAILLLFLRRHK